jgi:hypothetical protein
MYKIRSPRIISALVLSAILFAANAFQVEAAPAVDNVVFDEVNATTLTETLDGTQIGDWNNLGSGMFGNEPLAGTIAIANGQLAFLDPLNPGRDSGLLGASPFLIFYENVAPSFVFGSGAAVVPAQQSLVSDFLPFSETGAEVDNSVGVLEPVNITVVGPAAPDSAPTVLLLLIGGIGLAASRKQFRTV